MTTEPGATAKITKGKKEREIYLVSQPTNKMKSQKVIKFNRGQGLQGKI